ncbi:hypothetical protein DYI95_007820 [Thermaerobacter sp. PB12/4term]|uniref:hypothetical protein n=1 Tax=Thermaerobacter sp. PB12/4term TaxID=2293838 RepID=UPI001399206F|nr:hypothetical protein [Thermaerobacter sp. PB12/4term]QIA26131.1 hypothetical protein DYI95_007820 [Thermaerobacter sp. PB12/4term]
MSPSWHEARRTTSGRPGRVPLLLVERGRVPDVVRTCLLSVNPRHTEPAPPFMHGSIAGPPGEVACRVQFELEVLLRTVIE